MNYIEMSIDDAVKVLGETGMVLIAIQDLEHKKEALSFVKKAKSECKELLTNAKTIIKQCDDFVREMDLFTTKQDDIFHIKPEGKEIIILY